MVLQLHHTGTINEQISLDISGIYNVELQGMSAKKSIRMFSNDLSRHGIYAVCGDSVHSMYYWLRFGKFSHNVYVLCDITGADPGI